jgi:pSer/pThr/pTyr-binding forkhead associated (FHA) protein
MGLRLIIEDVEGATTIVPLTEEEVTIGRKGGNTIQLTEQNVSRNHARLRMTDGRWEITDLDSYNGVLVNGAPIAGTAVLREGDLIQIGDYHLVLADELEKRTVDLEQPTRAANDDEPLLASSSADLPRLTEADLVVLRSGAHAAVEDEEGEQEEGEALSSAPASPPRSIVPAVVAVAVLLGVVGGAAWLWADRGDEGRNVAATASPGSEPRPAEAAAEPGPSEAAPEVPAAEPAVVEPTAAEPEPGAEPEPTGTDTGALAAEPDEPPAENGASGPRPGHGPAGAPKKKKSGKPDGGDASAASAVPPPPSGPAKTAAQLMADARKAAMAGDAAKAYSLAKDAAEVGAGADALQLMGVSACKMGDASKARSAFRKLTGSKKQQLAEVCAERGIEL